MTDWKKRALGTRRRGHTVWVRIVEKEEGLDCLGVDHGLKTGFELFNEEEETEEAATTEVDSTNFDFSTIANRVSQEEGIPIDKDITTLSDDELFNF